VVDVVLVVLTAVSLGLTFLFKRPVKCDVQPVNQEVIQNEQAPSDVVR
jgi:biopolymer transport protein ExbD